MNSIRIGNRRVNDSEKSFIIAEAGSNHDLEKKNAYELIDAATEAKADAIKFQMFKADTLYSKYIGKDIYDKTKNVELPYDWIPDLISRCKSKKITFLATPFDIQSVDILNKHNISAFKWASGEIDNLELLSHASKALKPIILSTGMSNLTEIESAIKVINNEKNNQIALLHCISNYPTKSRDANLRNMETLRHAFNFLVGFSDHTEGFLVTIAAVSMGAKIIEKHLTLDKNLNSPDHPFSLKPDEFRRMVEGIREVESSFGDNKKDIIESEIPVSKIARKSLVASQKIPKGTKITRSMMSYKRPGTGIQFNHLPFILGRCTNRKIEYDEIISLDMFN